MMLPGSAQQADLTAEIVRGSGHVRILTGRIEPDGRPEVLCGARGRTDLDAIRRLDDYCARVQNDRKTT